MVGSDGRIGRVAVAVLNQAPRPSLSAANLGFFEATSGLDFVDECGDRLDAVVLRAWIRRSDGAVRRELVVVWR
jgi:hypothetical protein